MPTPEEIDRRVTDTDAPRTAKRAAAASRIAALAQERAAVAEKLDGLERELGAILADAQDVAGIDELARFTDIPAADLTRWLHARPTRKTPRPKRPKAAPITPTTPAPARPAHADAEASITTRAS